MTVFIREAPGEAPGEAPTEENTLTECITTVAALCGCKVLQLYKYEANYE